VYDLETRETFISRDVIFQENVFPFATPADPAIMRDAGGPRLTEARFFYDDFLDLGPIEDLKASAGPAAGPNETHSRNEDLGPNKVVHPSPKHGRDQSREELAVHRSLGSRSDLSTFTERGSLGPMGALAIPPTLQIL